ncbi:hypothetical protein GA0074692_2000 [Micromonospora pallida]|uniref:Uncharacterized protein n=1 Tax=Micromonospora pallida TaxID=145854 RepID=A0A1C6S847_9ACTN|nr:hypothetical protein [Micromonospora pallida]SCL25642.1 hypothetical protein GA0074692_2000 [Micromonospora pallida]
MFVGFNMPLLESANGLSVTDWGLNIAIPEVKVGLDDLRYGLELDKFLSGSDFLAPLFLSEMKNAERFGKLRDFASWLWSTGEFYGTGTSSDPAIMVIDVPGAGWGAEVSAFVTGGEFSCGGVVG